MSNEPRATHLGDGAYASTGSYGGEIIITANHHDPEIATDKVHLGLYEVANLVRFLQDVGYTFKRDGGFSYGPEIDKEVRP